MPILPQSTVPAQEQQFVIEDVTYGFDTTLLLSGAQTPTSPVFTLTKLGIPANTTITLADGSSTSGNVVSQRVRTNVLSAGSTYALQLVFQPSGTTNELVMLLTIVCPQ